MRIINIETPFFNRERSCMYTFELIDGDRMALNHLSQDMCNFYYTEHVDELLSFVIFDIQTLEDYSFALLKPSNLDGVEKGVEILAIGYNNSEAYNDLLEQIRFHIFSIKDHDCHLYDYIWAKNTSFTEYMAINIDNENAILYR